MYVLIVRTYVRPYIRTCVQDGCTPLHLAVENGNTEMVKTVIGAAGLDFTIKNEVSRSASELQRLAKTKSCYDL